jgi:valyl-tRNA synthetase
MQILIPLAGLIDKAAEITRLEREISKLQQTLEKTEARLNNPSFADKAPPEVVAATRGQADDQRNALNQLQEQLNKIRAL